MSGVSFRKLQVHAEAGDAPAHLAPNPLPNDNDLLLGSNLLDGALLDQLRLDLLSSAARRETLPRRWVPRLVKSDAFAVCERG